MYIVVSLTGVAVLFDTRFYRCVKQMHLCKYGIPQCVVLMHRANISWCAGFADLATCIACMHWRLRHTHKPATLHACVHDLTNYMCNNLHSHSTRFKCVLFSRHWQIMEDMLVWQECEEENIQWCYVFENNCYLTSLYSMLLKKPAEFTTCK